MNYDFKNKKEEFLVVEFLQYSINAGLQTRNEEFPIYRLENLSLDFAKRLRNEIKDFLLVYLKDFNRVDENGHVSRIIELSDKISKKYSEILYKKRFRIGVSQKIVNLFLKYMWTSGQIEMPFHCPIDNIIKTKVLKGIKNKALKDWTEFDKITDYMKYIDIIRQKSKDLNLTIAEWELENCKRK